MVLKLHYLDVSPPVRATMLTIHALGLENEVELIPVNLLAGEQMKPEYLKKNPLHTIPTLEDGDFILFDSHAINAYLVEKYGKDDSLYPKDLQKRATVNQRLHFDNGVVFAALRAIVKLIIIDGARTIPKELADNQVKAYNSLETLLGDNKFLAGNQVTIADFNAATTISTCDLLVPLASNSYPKISEWLGRVQELPYFNRENQVGVDRFREVLKTLNLAMRNS